MKKKKDSKKNSENPEIKKKRLSKMNLEFREFTPSKLLSYNEYELKLKEINSMQNISQMAKHLLIESLSAQQERIDRQIEQRKENERQNEIYF